MFYYRGTRDFGSGPKPINGTMVEALLKNDAKRECWMYTAAAGTPFSRDQLALWIDADNEATMLAVLQGLGYAVEEIQAPVPV
jgi:hypothetical protein